LPKMLPEVDGVAVQIEQAQFTETNLFHRGSPNRPARAWARSKPSTATTIRLWR
jgi:hypothetical protein